MKKITCLLILMVAWSTFAQQAKNPCAGRAVDTSEAGQVALRFATYTRQKQAVKSLLLEHCVSVDSGAVRPSYTFSQDVETFNWFLSRGADVKIDTVKARGWFIARLAAAGQHNKKAPEVPPLLAQEIKKKYGFETSATGRQTTTQEDFNKLTVAMASELPLGVLEREEKDGSNAAHVAVAYAEDRVVRVLAGKVPALFEKRSEDGFLPGQLLFRGSCVEMDDSKRETLIKEMLRAKDALTKEVQVKGMEYVSASVVKDATIFKAETPKVWQEIKAALPEDSKKAEAWVATQTVTQPMLIPTYRSRKTPTDCAR
jgi:hypothetical protein